ncbi:uncharacterized protein CTRU02_200025 [Colletotrichum truncatum]|uniref:Uncharacterized protein n=1 Tax=Colletotrichum truncatum TaxID=5467 RepID=A0ACC3ZDI2_COLTU|nr:uncharacterized protein CTRU02_04901 [Colletotrichum truncatum]KAF6794700.1 hypothetical protein CTRU02_04901 [Colletotrichum truncatum]
MKSTLPGHGRSKLGYLADLIYPVIRNPPFYPAFPSISFATLGAGFNIKPGPSLGSGGPGSLSQREQRNLRSLTGTLRAKHIDSAGFNCNGKHGGSRLNKHRKSAASASTALPRVTVFAANANASASPRPCYWFSAPAPPPLLRLNLPIRVAMHTSTHSTIVSPEPSQARQVRCPATTTTAAAMTDTLHYTPLMIGLHMSLFSVTCCESSREASWNIGRLGHM